MSADAGTLLQEIDACIRQSVAVICVLGDQYGNEPDSTEAAPFAAISRERHSYAQWQFLLAKYHGRSLLVFAPDVDAPLDHTNDESVEKRLRQVEFLNQDVESRGIVCVTFRNASELEEMVLCQLGMDLQDAETVGTTVLQA